MAAVERVRIANSARTAATRACAAVATPITTFASKALALAKASAQAFVTKMVTSIVELAIRKNVAVVNAPFMNPSLPIPASLKLVHLVGQKGI